MKYRKKPIIIEAVQFKGTQESLKEIREFGCKRANFTDLTKESLIIPTTKGNNIAKVGDWIIKGIKGEFYPCKPDIFELTYEISPEG